MSSLKFQIKRHSTRPQFRVSITKKNSAGVVEPFPLTGATAVRFLMRLAGQTSLKVDAAGVIEDEDGGVVRYDWVPTDTDTPGVYEGEIEITYVDPDNLTIPTNQKFFSITVYEDLDDA